MTLFEEMWRLDSAPQMSEVFGAADKAEYWDAGDEYRGSYQVMLGPEESTQQQMQSGENVMKITRLATFNFHPTLPFWQHDFTPEGTVIITEREQRVAYAVKEMLQSDQASATFTLHRISIQKKWARGGV